VTLTTNLWQRNYDRGYNWCWMVQWHCVTEVCELWCWGYGNYLAGWWSISWWLWPAKHHKI